MSVEHLNDLDAFNFQNKCVDLFTFSRYMNVNHKVSLTWPRLMSHELGTLFLPVTLHFHVLLLCSSPSDLGSSFKVRVGIWEDLLGRCVSEKPE